MAEESAALPGRTPAALPRRTEVVVIGGGIVGCATAYFLAEAGVPVVLFEKGRIAGEQSSRNWGWVRKQGRDPLELPAIIESLRIWQGLEARLGADLGWYQGGVTYLARNDQEVGKFEAWLEEARAYQLDTRLLSAIETDALLGQSERRWKAALYTPSDGRAEPAKAAPALAAAAERLGAKVFTSCAVRTVETEAGRVAGVVTERGMLACRAVVCAAGVWTSRFSRNLGVDLPQLGVKASVLRTKPAPLVTQSAVDAVSVAFRRRQDGGYSIAHGGSHVFELVPDAFRYLRAFLPAHRKVSRDQRLRLSTAFFRELMRPGRWDSTKPTVFEAERMLDPKPERTTLDLALAEAKRLFPQLAGIEVAETWAGVIETTPDRIPVMGAVEAPQGYFLASGFSGHGFGIGPAAGLLMAELVSKGRTRVDLTPFRLSRFTDGSPIRIYDTP